MKRLIISTCCFVLACLVFSFGILPNLVKAQVLDEPTPESCSSLTYVVKNFKGNVAVFEADAAEPFKITDVSINTLPYNDQNNLEKGITVNSKEELNSLLEDLCS